MQNVSSTLTLTTKNTRNLNLVPLGKNYFWTSPKSDQILGDHKN